MNRKIFNILLFTVGAAIGSAVTWKVVKTKYEQIVQEEIDSVKEEYSRLTKMMKKEVEAYHKITGVNQNEIDDDFEEEYDDNSYDDNVNDDDQSFDEQEMTDYYKISSRYRGESTSEDDEEGDKGKSKEAPYINGPYVIAPDDFSTSPPGYSAQALDYFADGVLADSWGVQLDVEETIGEDALEHFGDYTDDIVYVRNERVEIDYEVTRDPRTYAEAVQINPNPYYGR